MWLDKLNLNFEQDLITIGLSEALINAFLNVFYGFLEGEDSFLVSVLANNPLLIYFQQIASYTYCIGVKGF